MYFKQNNQKTLDFKLCSHTNKEFRLDKKLIIKILKIVLTKPLSLINT